MSQNRDYIGFTLNLRVFANVISQDPRCRRELVEGIKAADAGQREKLTSPLGAANLSPGEGTDDVWCTVFPATVKGKSTGEEGLFYRNDSRGGKGDRIQMRLRKQPPKSQQAQTPGATLPAGDAFAGVDLSSPAVQALLQAMQAAAIQTASVPVDAPATVSANVDDIL